MTNNPAYRQNWILDKLKVNPTESYNDMFAKYSQMFAINRRTFDKDWLKANATFSEYQQIINAAKLEESIAQEKEAVKRNIMDKCEAMEILTEIAQGSLMAMWQGKTTTPNFAERRAAIQTLSELQGWKSPVQIETKAVESTITFKII